jgi:hypothetical protein
MIVTRTRLYYSKRYFVDFKETDLKDEIYMEETEGCYTVFRLVEYKVIRGEATKIFKKTGYKIDQNPLLWQDKVGDNEYAGYRG